jgi:hypothetical protein
LKAAGEVNTLLQEHFWEYAVVVEGSGIVEAELNQYDGD